MARVVAVANQKGGVGKTTSVLALGAAVARLGQRVLLVDLDPQASLTSAAGIEPDDLDFTIYTAISHFMKNQEPPPGLKNGIVEIQVGLDLLPANIDLSVAELELQNTVRREYVLQEILEPLRDRYDIVLIDCPPSLSLLTINALTCADECVIPVVPEYLAARGLGLLLNSIERVRKSKLNPRIRVSGVILTMTNTRTNHSREVIASVRQHLDGHVPVLGEVKRSIKVAEAAAAGVPLSNYAPSNETSMSYHQIAEVLLGVES